MVYLITFYTAMNAGIILKDKLEQCGRPIYDLRH